MLKFAKAVLVAIHKCHKRLSSLRGGWPVTYIGEDSRHFVTSGVITESKAYDALLCFYHDVNDALDKFKLWKEVRAP